MKRNVLYLSLIFLSIFIYPNTGSAQSNWVKCAENPVLTPNGIYASSGYPFIYLVEVNDTLRVWFTEADGYSVSTDRIGYGTTTDKVNFNMYEWPVLEPSFGSNNFDSQGVFGASVIFDGEIYRMWYNGYNTQPYYDGEMQVGLATSPDGINWTKYSSESVLGLGSPGEWDDAWAYVNTVLFEDGEYKMWYTGAGTGSLVQIGYATSGDGVNWTRYSGNPVIEPSTLGFINVQNPRVIRKGNRYEMWFNSQQTSSHPFQIYYAKSDDGIVWNTNPNIVVPTGPAGSFDDIWVWHPCVIYEEGVYHMWYGGSNGSTYSVGYATDETQVGVDELPGNVLSVNDLNIYPNPASEMVQITFTIEKPAYTEVKILNALGEEIKLVTSADYDKGLHKMEVSIKELPSGVYYCHLGNWYFNKVSKLLVVR